MSENIRSLRAARRELKYHGRNSDPEDPMNFSEAIWFLGLGEVSMW